MSAFAHGAMLAALFISPAGVGGELPDSPASPIPAYVPHAALPRAPLAPRVSSAATTAAPVRAAAGITADEVPAAVGGPTVDGGLPDAGIGASVGVPSGIGDLPPPAPEPPSIPDPPKLVRVGGVIREPKRIVTVPAEYPDIARSARIEGLVIVEATIDERGFVTGARVLRSVPLLDSAALAALKQWRYTPTLLNGVPVRVLLTITFNFRLGDRTP
ncbi:MAG: energy transducer TonB [Vicinamibacterales bacterium]